MSGNTSPPDPLELIERTYAALYGAASWEDMLDRARRLLPNGQAVILFHERMTGRGAASVAAGFDPGMIERYNSTYSQINPWMKHANARPLGMVVQSDQMLPRSGLLRTQYFDEYLRPQDIETGLGVTIARENGHSFHFSIISSSAPDAAMTEARRTIEAIVPHLQIAFKTERERALGGASEPQRGTMRLGPDLRVKFADERALEILDGIEALAIGPQRYLTCRDRKLGEMIAAVAAGHFDGSIAKRPRSALLSRSDGGLPVRVSVYRPSSARAAFFNGSDCILHLEERTEEIPSAVAEFCNLHGLSAAETSILLGLAHQKTIEQIARDRGTSAVTVRTQIKTVFAKTGLSRQSDLAFQLGLLVGWGRPENTET